ncbi:MAG: RluA family pseudouridine synthase [Epsilonproteobacteria bacterium]|nr:RluA family pseudouridine synthase [Campylobacterota bacterium]
MPFEKKIIKTNKTIKLFKLLMEEFEIPLREAQRIIDTKKVFMKGLPVTDKSIEVKGEIEVIDFSPISKGLQPLFRAREFAVFDKPSGIMVHPRNRRSGYTLLDEVRWYFGKEANITHRLDKETSGLVLVSKNKRSEKILKRMFEEKVIKKSYLALVEGKVERELFIDEPILLNRDYSKIKVKVVVDKKGKKAQTIIKPIKYIKNCTLVEAIPLTGRQHQIRAHLFHVKHKIIGDPLYGVDFKIASTYLDNILSPFERVKFTGADRLMLHAQKLEFKFKETNYKIFSKQNFLKECYLSFSKSY